MFHTFLVIHQLGCYCLLLLIINKSKKLSSLTFKGFEKNTQKSVDSCFALIRAHQYGLSCIFFSTHLGSIYITTLVFKPPNGGYHQISQCIMGNNDFHKFGWIAQHWQRTNTEEALRNANIHIQRVWEKYTQIRRQLFRSN